MNAADLARTEGFRVALSIRGRSLAVKAPGGPTVSALVQTAEPEEDEFDVSPDMTNAARIAVLRVDLRAVLPAAETVSGLVLYDVDTGASYRVTRVKDQPADIAVRLTCEVSEAVSP